MYYTVRQLAKKMGVTEHTIRFYTDEGVLPCRRDVNNRRVFNDEAVEWLNCVQSLRNCGYTLVDIRSYREMCLEDDPSTLKTRYLIMKRAAEAAKESERRMREVLEFTDEKLAEYEQRLENQKAEEK